MNRKLLCISLVLLTLGCGEYMTELDSDVPQELSDFDRLYAEYQLHWDTVTIDLSDIVIIGGGPYNCGLVAPR